MIIKIPQEFKKYPQLKGIFVGGCVVRGVGSSFRAKAHAHTGSSGISDEFVGWICVRSSKRLYMECVGMTNGKPSRLLWHELAHLISNSGHDDKWRKVMKELGQPLPNQYHKQKRGIYERR